MDPVVTVTPPDHVFELVVFFIAQSVIIIGAIVSAYVKTQVAIERVRGDNQANHTQAMTEIGAVKENTKGLKSDHGNLAGQVGSISRSLARLEGHVNATRPFEDEEEG